jgi:hypothetical protein
MVHRNASRPDPADGEGGGHPTGRAIEQTPIVVDDATARVVRRGRRIACPDDTDGIQGAGVPPRRAGAAKGVSEMEPLDVLIVQQWTKSLKGPYDWGDWPLARYTIGAGVLRAAERSASTSARRVSPAVRRLAWACAMVACGRAQRLRSLDPRPQRDDSDEPIVRSDGSRGWLCNLERDNPEGPRLHYWVQPSGRIEFDTVLAPSQEPCTA